MNPQGCQKIEASWKPALESERATRTYLDKTFPRFESYDLLRSDSRFQDLLRRMNLQP